MFLVSLNLGNSITFIKNNAEADARALKRGYLAACDKGGFPGPNETTRSRRYPAFFFYVAKKVEMFHSVLGYSTEKSCARHVLGMKK